MLEQVLVIFLGKENLVKKFLHPSLGNYSSKEQFLRCLQNLSSLHKNGWRSAEKIALFKMLLLS
jgi:hypothetical protein